MFRGTVANNRMSLATFSRRERLHLCNNFQTLECASLAERIFMWQELHGNFLLHKNTCPNSCCWDRYEISTCGATRLDVNYALLLHTHIFTTFNMPIFDYGGSYSVSHTPDICKYPFPFALGSPFMIRSIIASHQARLSLDELAENYYSSSTVLLIHLYTLTRHIVNTFFHS